METIQPNLEDLQLFAEINRCGSFTRAANHTGFSKSYISKKVTKLETTLGHKLLIRNTRKLALTQAGKRILPFCIELISTKGKIIDELSLLDVENVGKIKVAMPIEVSDVFCQEILADFYNLYPNIHITVMLYKESYCFFEQDIDLAIQIGHDFNDAFVYRELIKMSPLLVATPHYLKSHPPIATPSDLLHHQCLVDTSKSDPTIWAFYHSNKMSKVNVCGCFSSDQLSPIKSAVLNHSGIARLPYFFIHNELEQGNLVRILPDFKSKMESINLVFPFQKNRPKRLITLIEFLEKKALQVQKKLRNKS